MQTKQLFDYIHNEVFGKELMEKASQIDTNANGIQIEGSQEINKVAIGVSCNYEFLEKAKKWGSDVCIFHHGMSLSEKHSILNSRLSLALQKQLRIVFENEITIAGYHFCLDADPDIGNNVLIAKYLGLKNTGEKYFDDWGIVAKYENGKNIDEIAQECSKLFKHDVFMVRADGKEMIKKIGICSGGAKPLAQNHFEIAEKNIDLHITGEIGESGVAQAKDNDYNYFACGHYATEVFGIKTLGEKINEKFPELDVRFIEVWNEI